METERPGFVSVTTALQIIRKPGLEQWRGKVGNEEADRIAEEAADRGTDIHDRFASIMRGDDIEDPSMIDQKMIAWKEEHVKGVLQIETRLYDEIYKFHGKPDAIARVDGKLAVIDLKTGKFRDRTWCYQLAAYAKLAEVNEICGMLKEKIARLVLVNNGKEFEAVWLGKNWSSDFRMFVMALQLYRDYTKGGLS